MDKTELNVGEGERIDKSSEVGVKQICPSLVTCRAVSSFHPMCLIFILFKKLNYILPCIFLWTFFAKHIFNKSYFLCVFLTKNSMAKPGKDHKAKVRQVSIYSIFSVSVSLKIRTMQNYLWSQEIEAYDDTISYCNHYTDLHITENEDII